MSVAIARYAMATNGIAREATPGGSKGRGCLRCVGGRGRAGIDRLLVIGRLSACHRQVGPGALAPAQLHSGLGSLAEGVSSGLERVLDALGDGLAGEADLLVEEARLPMGDVAVRQPDPQDASSHPGARERVLEVLEHRR